MSLVWLNGRPATGLAVDDRGLAYGDGLFETLRVADGQIPLLARHLARLREGCGRLAIPLDEPLLRQELDAFGQQLGRGVCKLILTRGRGQRGYAPPRPAAPQRLLQGAPLPAYPAENRERGVRLFPCVTRLAEQPRLAGLKHLNRLEQVLARSEWQSADYAEGLMRDMSGRIVEGVFSNLFLVRDGVLLTASLERCGVAGVMRAELLARASAAGWPVEVRDLADVDLAEADEVFLCNSLYGIWPVVALESRGWPVGPLTRTLQGWLAPLMDVP